MGGGTQITRPADRPEDGRLVSLLARPLVPRIGARADVGRARADAVVGSRADVGRGAADVGRGAADVGRGAADIGGAWVVA